MIRILLVDDQKTIREALKLSLEPEIDFQIIGTADNGISAIEQVEELKPDIVLMNMQMPGLDGASATQFITNKFGDTKVLILSSEDDNEYIAKSLSVGAKGYILKNRDFRDIATAIRSVYMGYTQIGPGLMEKLLIKTDSGAIISRLSRDVSPEKKANVDRDNVFVSKTKKAIISLKNAFRNQRAEQNNFRITLEQIQIELLETRETVTKQSKYLRFTWVFLAIFFPLVFFGLFDIYSKINNLERNIIPVERIGLYGEYNLSGLAQRVARTFQQDSVLSNINTVYIAQNGNTIVLKGEIEDSSLISRMRNLAKEVKGVSRVDDSQLIVSPQI